MVSYFFFQLAYPLARTKPYLCLALNNVQKSERRSGELTSGRVVENTIHSHTIYTDILPPNPFHPL